MRHIYGTALAIVMIAAMFFCGAWGYLRLLRLPEPPAGPGALPGGGGSLLSDGVVLVALAAVVATGVLAGVLVAVPGISPLAPGLPGLVLIGWTVLYLASARRAGWLVPLRSHTLGAGWEALLFNGVLGAAGLAMAVPMCIPSRWRGGPRVPDGAAAAGGDGDREAATRPRDLWEPAVPGGATATGAFAAPPPGAGGHDDGARPRPSGPSAGPFGSAPGPVRTGPVRSEETLRTTSPIQTTGPIRLNSPKER